MFKKIFAIATMLCVFPVMAQAWTLTTAVKSQGGSITSPNKATAQTVVNGTIRKNYISASETVTITPDAGFRINKLTQNGAITGPFDTVAPITVSAAGTNNVAVTFARKPLSLTATAGANGTVDKASYPTVFAGVQSPVKTFTFTPNPGFAVQSITPTGGTIGTHFQYLNAANNAAVTVPAATGVKVKVRIYNVPGSMTFAAAFSGTTPTPVTIPTAANVAQLGRTQCEACHSTQGVGSGVFNSWSASVHKQSLVMCYSCHAGANAGAHPGVAQCASCHTTSLVATPTADFASCAPCHSGADVHSFQTAGNSNDCVGCHDVAAPQHAANLVGDNNGVRAITGEFAKRSHHVTGRAVTNADCAVCHLEGKASGTAIVIDPLYHMADNKTHLRNANPALVGNQTKATVGAGGQSEYAWNPAAPDHALMDQFCFSCHNEVGAPTAAAALVGVTGYTGTALNPFGDSVSNSYDQVSRVNVVGVYEQFDTANSSHHAVRGQKYTASALTDVQSTNISTANYNFVNGAVVAPIKGTMVNKGGVSPVATAVAGTMFSAGRFNATYTTLNAAPLADNQTLHCGDCHTVGQFRAADVNPAVGSYNKAVIGAHGSGNEYMLRNTNGDDTLNANAIVCNICHSVAAYGVPAGSDHNSVNSSDDHCDDDIYNTAGLNGAARLLPEEGLIDDATFQAELAAGKYAATGGGNIFAIKCLSCHNASDKKTFGGIHGNAGNASFTTYSGNKASVTGAVTAVQRKPYRFLPGLGNFRYNGGDGADQWMVKTVSQANKQGCYTLNGASARSGAANPAPTKAVASGANVSALAIADDGGVLGSWGACTDHAGTSVFGGRATTRSLLRPLTY